MDEFEDFGAKRRNAEDCERIAATLRKALGGVGDDRMPPLMEIFENARLNVPEASKLDFIVRTDEAMGDAAAFAKPDLQEIHGSVTFAQKAQTDSSEARFIGTHELVHVIFHRGAPIYFRKNAGNIIYSFLDKQQSSEWQADSITRAIHMPPKMVATCTSAYQLAEKSGMPIKEAIERIRELEPDKPRATPSDVASKLAALNRDAAKGTPGFRRLEAEAVKIQLWNDLPTIDGEPAAGIRLCGKYQIWWNDFGKTTGCGWYIENGKIVPFFGSRSP